MAAPAGLAALPSSYCEAAGPPSHWRFGLGGGWLSSDIVMDGRFHGTFEDRMVLANATWSFADLWALRAGAGMVVDGAADVGGERRTLGTGWLAEAAISRVFLTGQPVFLLGAFGLSASSASADGPAGKTRFSAGDGRLTVTVGRTFFDRVSPYLSGTVFGGPIFYRTAGADLTGTDTRHWQLAAGLAAALPKRVDLFVEWAPLGERALSAGVGFTP